MSISIKKNFFYSSILTSANYLFPLLTYPYVSRILGVTNIGICNFVDSVINYFILVSAMGVNILGIREIAKSKNNRIELDKTFSSIFLLNTCTTFIALFLLLIAAFTIPQLSAHRSLMIIGAVKLLFNYLLIEWLYKGLEEFKYITTRTLIVKISYVIAVFIFVRKSEDYSTYYLLTVSMIVINAFFNTLYSKKFVSLRWNKLELKRYLKPFFTFGAYLVITSMYTSFNVAYLGFIAGEKEVGFYTTATKLYAILLSLFTAFTGVMLPRMSALMIEKKDNEIQLLLNKSIDFLFNFSIPLIILTTVCAPQIIAIIAGKGYEGAILPMRIVMPLIFIIGYEQILIIQTLMPMKKDKAVLINSILGATVGFTLNILLVSTLESIGSAIVWLASEVTVLISAQHFVTKYTKMTFPWKLLFKHLIHYLPLIIIAYLLYIYIGDNIYILYFLSAITIVYFLISNFQLINKIIFTQR